HEIYTLSLHDALPIFNKNPWGEFKSDIIVKRFKRTIMKASDLFVKSLEMEGVEYIFGVPGEENLDFLESLRKSKIKLVVTRHEQDRKSTRLNSSHDQI